MIELKKLRDIKLNKDNPRIFEDSKVEDMVRSLKDFPTMLWLNPLKLNDENTVLAGNMRTTGITQIFALSKAERTQLLQKFTDKINESNILQSQKDSAINKAKTFFIDKLVPTMYANDLTEEQEIEYLLKDNISFGKWDIDKLTTDFDLKNLMDWGLDESLWSEATDFNDDEGSEGDNTKGTSNNDLQDNPYTTKIEAPIYETKNEKPEISQLFDNQRYLELIQEIESLDI